MRSHDHNLRDVRSMHFSRRFWVLCLMRHRDGLIGGTLCFHLMMMILITLEDMEEPILNVSLKQLGILSDAIPPKHHSGPPSATKTRATANQ